MVCEKGKWKRTSSIRVNGTQTGFRGAVMHATWVTMVLFVYTEHHTMKLAGRVWNPGRLSELERRWSSTQTQLITQEDSREEVKRNGADN